MKILVFPKDSGNPYQSQLFNPMRAKGVQIGYLKLSTINPIVDIFSIIQLIGYRFWVILYFIFIGCILWTKCKNASGKII